MCSNALVENGLPEREAVALLAADPEYIKAFFNAVEEL